jgi:hypothetical protein
MFAPRKIWQPCRGPLRDLHKQLFSAKKRTFAEAKESAEKQQVFFLHKTFTTIPFPFLKV